MTDDVFSSYDKANLSGKMSDLIAQRPEEAGKFITKWLPLMKEDYSKDDKAFFVDELMLPYMDHLKDVGLRSDADAKPLQDYYTLQKAAQKLSPTNNLQYANSLLNTADMVATQHTFHHQSLATDVIHDLEGFAHGGNVKDILKIRKDKIIGTCIDIGTIPSLEMAMSLAKRNKSDFPNTYDITGVGLPILDGFLKVKKSTALEGARKIFAAMEESTGKTSSKKNKVDTLIKKSLKIAQEKLLNAHIDINTNKDAHAAIDILSSYCNVSDISDESRADVIGLCERSYNRAIKLGSENSLFLATQISYEKYKVTKDVNDYVTSQADLIGICMDKTHEKSVISGENFPQFIINRTKHVIRYDKDALNLFSGFCANLAEQCSVIPKPLAQKTLPLLLQVAYGSKWEEYYDNKAATTEGVKEQKRDLMIMDLSSNFDSNGNVITSDKRPSVADPSLLEMKRHPN